MRRRRSSIRVMAFGPGSRCWRPEFARGGRERNRGPVSRSRAAGAGRRPCAGPRHGSIVARTGRSPTTREGGMSFRVLATVAAIAAIASVPAAAQDFPTRPLTLVVPYAPGGPADIVTRIVTPKMTEVLGQQIIVENVPGAGGMTGAARVARAAPDGYTFMQGPAGVMTQNQSLYSHPLVD